MSVNKNLKFSDYKEVIIQADEVGKDSLLVDLINSTSVDNNKKVIASIFLLAKYKNTDVTSFLVLKPKCLWLRIEGGTLKDVNDSSTSIAKFQDYKAGEIVKVSFLSNPKTVSSILASQGVTLSSINGLQNVFTYDLNESNRTRSAAISPVGNSNLNNIWL